MTSAPLMGVAPIPEINVRVCALPMRMVWDSSPAPALPMKRLLLPFVSVTPAWYPIAMFFVPRLFLRAWKPMTVLLLPAVLC